MMSGLDIHYDLGEGHPLLGRRMPDLDLVTADGRLRVFELLHDARPVLVDLGEPGGLDITPWADRVAHVVAGSNAVRVESWDGTATYRARVVFIDAALDIAVLAVGVLHRAGLASGRGGDDAVGRADAVHAAQRPARRAGLRQRADA